MGGKLAVTREDWIAKVSPDSFGVEIGVLEGEFSQLGLEDGGLIWLQKKTSQRFY
jgi:hypothetical protein